VDINPLDGSDPDANYEIVERELRLHEPRLAALPRVLVLSKVDLVEPGTATAAQSAWRQRLGPDVPVLLTSSATGAGLRALAAELLRRIPIDDRSEQPDQGPRAQLEQDLAEHRVFRPAEHRAYRVQRLGERSFRVTGAGIERLVARYDLDNEEALAHLERRLKGIGVIRALEAEGFEPGDDVEIAGVAFELDPSM
jgi:GTPase